MKRLWQHRTKISGYLTVLSSAAYVGLPVLQTVVSPRTFAIGTFSLGVLTALIGHFNTSVQQPDLAQRFRNAVSGDEEGEDE